MHAGRRCRGGGSASSKTVAETAARCTSERKGPTVYAGAMGVATVISDSNKRQLVGRVLCRWARDGRAFRRLAWL